MFHTFLKKTINQKDDLSSKDPLIKFLQVGSNDTFPISTFDLTHFAKCKKVDVKINDLNESFAIPRTHQLNQAKKNLAKGHTNSNDEILMFQLHGLRPFSTRK